MRLQELVECSGYIPKNETEAKDPRWSRALSVDVGIHTMEQQLADIFPSKPIGSSRLQQVTESIDESQLDEIERLRPSDYTGGKSYLYSGNGAKQFKKLPGGSGLLYSIEGSRGDPTIKLWDPNTKTADPKPRKDPYEFASEFNARLKKWEERQRSGKKIPQIIGKLSLETPYSFPLQGALQVGTITVDEDYRGMGLAKALYGIVLTIMKRPLVAGDSQTPGGRKNWVSLSQIPGVEMKGFIAVNDHELSMRPGENDFDAPYKKYIQKINTGREKNIDVIMGELGGQYIGEKHDMHYFAFDVQPNTTGTELEAYVKQKMVSVYGRKSEYGGGLYAVWTGQ